VKGVWCGIRETSPEQDGGVSKTWDWSVSTGLDPLGNWKKYVVTDGSVTTTQDTVNAANEIAVHTTGTQ